MTKMRLHIFIAMGVFLLMFILGSFLDLQLSKAIFSQNNGFGLTVAALSMNVGYAVTAFMGGVILYHGLKLTNVTWQKVLFILLAVAFYGGSVYFDGGEFFGPNGWNLPKIAWAGYLIAAPIMGAAMFGGYVAGKKANNPRLWLLVIVAAIFVGLALVLGTVVVKNIFHRPRYRMAVYGEISPFFNWWERCGNYKDLMQKVADRYQITLSAAKEEFKSFPSGHTSVCSLGMFFVVLYPFVSGKEMKNQVLFFYLALAYALFIAFTRLLVGAHFLSDVGMGGLLSTVCLYGFYEVAARNPKLYQVSFNEEPVQE